MEKEEVKSYSAENRSRFMAALTAKDFGQAICVLKSSKMDMAWFYYLFGVKPTTEYVGVIEVGTGKVTLFHEEGTPCEDYEVRKREELSHFLKETKPSQIMVIEGTNQVTGQHVDLVPNWEELKSEKQGGLTLRVQREAGLEILSECRVFKSKTEIARLRKAQEVAAEAVLLAMKAAKPGCIEKKLNDCMDEYCKNNYKVEEYAYPMIVATGKNIANLRHFEADGVIGSEDLMLVDMSLSLEGYASDLSTTFPANGKYTSKQRQIYEIALEANRKVIQSAKPGVWWLDMHLMSERIILEGLQKIGIIKAESDLTAVQNKGVGSLFVPYGVGHLVGLDIIDVGGYLKHTPKRSEKVNLKQLRHGRILEAGMVMSVEPGFYFDLKKIEDSSLNTEDIDREVLESCAEIGGVRVEDLVVITETGCEVLTSGDFPRTVEEIEKFLISSQ